METSGVEELFIYGITRQVKDLTSFLEDYFDLEKDLKVIGSSE